MNSLIAEAELALTKSEIKEPCFVGFLVKQYFERIRREAKENWDVAQRVCQKMLSEL